MSIPINILEKVETISTLKVLIYFYKTSSDNGILKASQKDIVEGSGITRNSVKNALTELETKSILKKIAEGKGNNPSTYQVSKVGGSKVDHQQEVGSNIGVSKVDPQGWKKSFGARKKKETEPDNIINNNINKNILKDFKEFNFINNDINSLSVVNENIYLTDKELGQLARRVLVEWFLPLAQPQGKLDTRYFPQQMKMLKDLLVKYRTEQVLASIEYWTKVNPPKNGVTSVKWLTFDRKGVDYVMIACDYYKQQFVANANNSEERLQKVEEMKTKAQEIVQQKNEEREKVKQMSDNDFLSNLLGGLGSIKVGD